MIFGLLTARVWFGLLDAGTPRLGGYTDGVLKGLVGLLSRKWGVVDVRGRLACGKRDPDRGVRRAARRTLGTL